MTCWFYQKNVKITWLEFHSSKLNEAIGYKVCLLTKLGRFIILKVCRWCYFIPSETTEESGPQQQKLRSDYCSSAPQTEARQRFCPLLGSARQKTPLWLFGFVAARRKHYFKLRLEVLCQGSEHMLLSDQLLMGKMNLWQQERLWWRFYKVSTPLYALYHHFNIL